MPKKLLLVDYENKHKVDLSPLDANFRAIIFVGANQHAPKASTKRDTGHKFSRVDFLKISGAGKNALDFHIAFELGRTFESAPATQCFVLSGDKGFDPLLRHLNAHGMDCRRVESVSELLTPSTTPAENPVLSPCPHCKKASSIEHHGGRWCTNCGRFASPPDPALLPSNQRGYQEPDSQRQQSQAFRSMCGWCRQKTDMSGGIYDDGEWMCGGCITRYAR